VRRETVLFVGRRLLQLVPVVLAIAALNFLLLKMAPGDAADILAGQMGHATLEFTEQLRREFGLDLPLIEQFLVYLRHLATLDLGTSLIQQQPVLDLILDRLPATLLLMVAAIVIAVASGVTLGVVAARRQGGWVDNVISVAALLVYATPAFWLGLMLIVLFSIRLDILPSGGMMQIGVANSSFAHALDVARHLVLPALTMGLFYAAIYARLMRASMLEVYGQDFVRTARAKGLTRRQVLWGHVLRNAMIPVMTLMGLQFANLLAGAIVIENVFYLPGLGRLIFQSIANRDLIVVRNCVMLLAAVVVIVNFVVDVLYAFIDPRIKVHNL